MRINGFHIDGFGIFSNQGIQDIPDGLVLFFGKNEGGKTTLMEFIRMVLFGLPKKGMNDYQPLRGGNHGGRLRITMEDGRIFTIERQGKRPSVIRDDGTMEQVEPSSLLLRGIDRLTFERIFAIGLEDMEGLDVLSQEGVRGRLLAASTGVGAASVPIIIKQIDGELENLLRSRGKNPKINALVKEIERVNDEIKKLQSQSAEYRELQYNLAQLKEENHLKRSESDSIRQKITKIEQLKQARAPWVNLLEARNKVMELEYARHFPTNGLERLEKLKDEIELHLRDKKALETKIKGLESQLSRFLESQEFRLKVIEYRNTIKTLVKEREKLNSALSDLPVVKAQMESQEKDFQSQLNKLGTDWTPERLKNIDTSVQTRQRVQEFARQLEAAERKWEQAQNDKQNLEKTERDARRMAEEAQKAFDVQKEPTITNMEDLRKKREVLKRMRSVFHQQENIRIQRLDKIQRLSEEKERLAALENRKNELTKPIPLGVPIIALIAGLSLSAIGAIWSPYILTPILALAGIGLMFWLLGLRQKQTNRKKSQDAEIREERRKLNQKIEDLENVIEKLDIDLKNNLSFMKIASREGDIPQPENIDKLDSLEAQLDDNTDKLRTWLDEKQKADNAILNWQKTQEQLKESQQVYANAQGACKELELQWQEWISERGFHESIRPEGFEVILQMVENARASEKGLQESQQRVRKMETYIDEIRQRIREALANCNIKPLGTEIGLSELDTLEHTLNEALEQQRKQEELQRQLNESRENHKVIEERLEKKQNEFNDLLQKAGASDEEDFRRRARSYEDWVFYTKQIEANNRALLAIAGTVEAQETLEKELEENDSQKLKFEEDEVKEKLNEVNKRISEIEQEIGRLQLKLDQMAHDERLSELLLKHRTLKEEMDEAIKRWVTIALTRHLLDQARGIYERERQPKVIQEATKFLEIMTGKQYRMVMPDENSQNIQLEDKSTFQRKSEIGWSSGLADQVYLAIRFGLARDFAQHEESLPIILDDVMVRFDPDRQLGTAKVILDLSKYHQVLMFTCNPAIPNIIQEALDNHNDINVTYYTIRDGMISREYGD